MSHNRKNIGRQFKAPQDPKVNNRKFVYLLVLVIAAGLLLGLILTPSPAKAAVSSPRNCWDGPSYTHSVWVGSPTVISLSPAEARAWITTERCRFDGIRVEIAKANTRLEYKAMRKEAMTDGLSNTWLFCPTTKGRKAYSIYWIWHVKDIVPFTGERQRYNRWAKAYGKTHGCEVNS